MNYFLALNIEPATQQIIKRWCLSNFPSEGQHNAETLHIRLCGLPQKNSKINDQVCREIDHMQTTNIEIRFDRVFYFPKLEQVRLGSTEPQHKLMDLVRDLSSVFRQLNIKTNFKRYEPTITLVHDFEEQNFRHYELPTLNVVSNSMSLYQLLPQDGIYDLVEKERWDIS